MFFSFRSGGALNDALDFIEQSGKLRFQTESDVKPLLDQRITIEIVNASIEETLATVLKVAKLTYKVLDDHTVQILKPEK